MLRRAGVIALLVFQAVWLNAVLPGHTRGVVTVWDNSRSSESASDESAASKHSCCGGHESDSGKPSKERAKHCAICFFAAKLTFPTTIDLTPAPLKLVDVIAVEHAQTPPALPFAATYLGRAPPTA